MERVNKLFIIILVVFSKNNGTNGLPDGTEEEASASVSVTLKIDQGVLKGVTEMSRGPPSRVYYQFLGIPYGHVEHRFSEAVPAGNWEGHRDASEYAAQCFQRGMGEEQCLFLNVFTPSLPSEGGQKKLPGGAFILGGGNIYGANYWMDEDCVVVTINYRLGVFGFLNLETDQVPGNQGLKDQILALKWVQKNIHSFNGDPERVMIFGESAGAGSVSYLVLTPLSKGLFTSAVSQSGTALCPWALNSDVVSHSKILTQKLNCTGTNDQILTCLREVDAMDILRAYPANLIPKNMGEEHKEVLKAVSFIPGVESRPASEVKTSTVFLPKAPKDLLEDRKFQNVPYIIGMNIAEGMLFQKGIFKDVHSPEQMKASWAKMGPDALMYSHSPRKDEITEKIYKFYFEGQPEIGPNVTNMVTDHLFSSCSHKVADIHSEISPTYLYMFEKTGGFSLMTFALGDSNRPKRPTHADEMSFQWKFNSPFLGGVADITNDPENTENFPLFNYSREFVKMWVHFAQHGKPRDVWETKEISPKWGPVDPKTLDHANWLYFNNDGVQFAEETEDLKKRIQFWKDLAI